MRTATRVLVVAASVLLPGLSRAQGPAPARVRVIQLQVLDDATDAALAGVRVSVVGRPTEVASDDRGMLVIASPSPGERVALVLRRLGYQPGTMMIDVDTSDTIRVSFAMAAVPKTLDSVAVTAERPVSPMLRTFDDRVAHHNGGVFITRDEIERRHPIRLTDLLRRYPSIKVVDSAGVLLVATTRSGKPVFRGGRRLQDDLAPCNLRVAVDGQAKEPSFSIDILAAESIYGIEVYAGPGSLPPEFASTMPDAMCGLVAIWTRRQ